MKELERIVESVGKRKRRLTRKEAEEAFALPPHTLFRAAFEARRRDTDPTTVTYVVDRNINYTNVCHAACLFCAFWRREGDSDAYVLSPREVLEKIEPLVALGGTQVLLQGGLNPHVPLSYLEDLFRLIRTRYPMLDIHSLTATEIDEYAKREGRSYEEILRRLKEAGLKSLPGGGMEILSDRVRARVSPKKSKSDVYVEIHRTAHRLGMTSTATMMFGMGEEISDRVEHWDRIRSLQDETLSSHGLSSPPDTTEDDSGAVGFTAFIPWSFQTDGSTALKRDPPSSLEYLKVVALSRLFLDNIRHIQAGWVTEGPETAQVALRTGADDWGGILMEENVISAAGTLHGMSPPVARWWIRRAGFLPAQRTTYYRVLQRFPHPTKDESPFPERPLLEVHLGHVGNRGRPPRTPKSLGSERRESPQEPTTHTSRGR